ncbi:MAG: discoidin domain-containing protein, partial [Planctomycetota bacterium]|nr:discoidin domain-containing protein [Planctomycetota bacterium]
RWQAKDCEKLADGMRMVPYWYSPRLAEYVDREDALPASYVASPHPFSFYGMLGHYWPDIEIAYTNGSRMTIKGIGGVNHDQRLDGNRGFWVWPEAQDAKEPAALVFAPPDKARAGPKIPYFTAKADKPLGIFFESEPVVFRLRFARAYSVPGKWLARWRIVDHILRPVAEGETAFSLAGGKDEEVAIALEPKQMGFFRAWLTLANATGGSTKATKEFCFARIRPEKPEMRDLLLKGGAGEIAAASLLGMRGIRTGVEWKMMWKEGHNPDGTLIWDKCLAGLRAEAELAKKGTIRGIFSFLGACELPEGYFRETEKFDAAAEADKSMLGAVEGKKGGDDLEALTLEDAPKAAGQGAKPGEAAAKAVGSKSENAALTPQQQAERKAREAYLMGLVAAAAKFGITQWEPINEPNLIMSPEAYLENILKVQYPAVKKANPQANFLGGGICGIENHPWIRRLYEIGADKYFDGVALHPYTGHGFQEIYRAHLQEVWQILRDFNDEKAGIWLTESAWHRGWGFHPYAHERFGGWPESHARHICDLVLNSEAMGVPRERMYIFYLCDHGYNEFFLLAREWPLAAAIALQVLNETLRDARFVREEPLPGPGHHLLVFRDEARAVLAAYTNGEAAELALRTDAAEAVVTDIMGNRRTVKPEGGKIKLTIDGDAAYIVLPATAKVEPDFSDLRVQPNLALVALGAKAAASAADDKTPPEAAISGDWTGYSTAWPLAGRIQAWLEPESGKDKFPDWFEVRLPQPAAISRVRLAHDYGAWERPLRDFEIQVFVGETWKTVSQVKGNTNYNSLTAHDFPAVETDRVRVLIHAVNAACFDQIDWIPHLSSLRGIEVYAAPGKRAKAFFVYEPPQPLLLPPGESAKLRWRLRNATEENLKAEVKMRASAGVSVTPPAQTVTLAPRTEAMVEASVKIDAAAAGLQSIMATAYEGAEMISADHSCRVICVKAQTAAKSAEDKNRADGVK